PWVIGLLAVVAFGGRSLAVAYRGSLPPRNSVGVADRLRPPERVHVRLLRQQELEERLALEAARLRDGQQQQVLRSHSLGKQARDLPLHGQLADCPLRHVILPRNAVLRQEGEEALSVAFEPLLVCPNRLGRVLPPGDVLVVESIDIFEELTQVVGL